MCVTDFVLSWGAILTTVPESRQFHKGLIFVKETDELLSGDKWTIAVNTALDDNKTLVEVMRLMLEQVRYKIQTYKNPRNSTFDIHWEEIT
jgi:hypothetical protein